jgi:hypothetical protein
MADLFMTALTGPILMIGVVLTALLFAFGVRRLLGLRLPLPRALLAGVKLLFFSSSWP